MPGDGDQHRPDKKGVGEQRIVAARRTGPEKDCACAELDQQREAAQQRRILPHTEPECSGGRDRPQRGGDAIVERQRNGDRREDRRQCEERAREQRQARFGACTQQYEQQAVNDRQRRGAPGCAVLDVAHQSDLESEADQRHAEDQQAIDRRARFEAAAMRIQDCDRDIEDDKQDQKRLDRREIERPVIAIRPDRAQNEGEDESKQVQRTPRAHPGQREDRRVEDREIAEQQRRLAGNIGQHRREKAAGDGESGQRLRVGADRKRDRRRGDQCEQQQARHRRQDVIQAKGGERRQIQDACARALQRKPVSRPSACEPDADGDQHDADDGHADQSPFDRDSDDLGEIAQQECHAEKENHDADPRQRVAAGEPRPHRIRIRRGRRSRCGHRDGRASRRRGHRQRGDDRRGRDGRWCGLGRSLGEPDACAAFAHRQHCPGRCTLRVE